MSKPTEQEFLAIKGWQNNPFVKEDEIVILAHAHGIGKTDYYNYRHIIRNCQTFSEFLTQTKKIKERHKMAICPDQFYALKWFAENRFFISNVLNFSGKIGVKKNFFFNNKQNIMSCRSHEEFLKATINRKSKLMDSELKEFLTQNLHLSVTQIAQKLGYGETRTIWFLRKFKLTCATKWAVKPKKITPIKRVKVEKPEPSVKPIKIRPLTNADKQIMAEKTSHERLKAIVKKTAAQATNENTLRITVAGGTYLLSKERYSTPEKLQSFVNKKLAEHEIKEQKFNKLLA